MRIRRNRLAAAVAAALVLAAAPQAHAAPIELERAPPGSLLERVPPGAPVRVIERSAIQRSGAHSLADLLRQLPHNSFGSQRVQGTGPALGVSRLALRGLDSGRTLVLLDGRRLPYDAATGQGQDLSLVPLAAVQRIEVLATGASAVFGTDAIGGVVNIVTRARRDGGEFSLGAGDPDQPGAATEQGSATFGTDSARGSLVMGVAWANREAVLASDRPFAAPGVSTFANNFRSALPSAPAGYAPGSFLTHPEFGASVPGGCTGPGFRLQGSGPARRCLYDVMANATDEEELRQEAVWMRAQYRLAVGWQATLRASVVRGKSWARLAPGSSTWAGTGSSPSFTLVPPGSPNHPAVRVPDAGYDPTQPLYLQHRFAAVGNRDRLVDAASRDVSLGAQGRVGDVDLALGARSAEVKRYELGSNEPVKDIVAARVADGSYDIYDPFGIDPGILDSLVATTSRDAESRIEEVFAEARLDLFQLPAGASRLTAGVEQRDERFASLPDTLQRAGQVAAGGRMAEGDRSTISARAAWQVPLTDLADAGLLARYDDFGDAGNAASWLASGRWQLLGVAVLHGHVGHSARAPSLDLVSFPTEVQLQGFSSGPGFPCPEFLCDHIVPVFTIPNPALRPETARHWSIGVDLASTWFSAGAAYHGIEVQDRLFSAPAPLLVSCVLGATDCPAGVSALPGNATPPLPGLGLGVGLLPDGRVTYIQRGVVNRGRIDAEMIDVRLGMRSDWARWGALDVELFATHVSGYRVDGGQDQVGGPSMPAWRATLASTWSAGSVELAWQVHFIHSTRSTAGQQAAVGGSDYGYPHRIPSWTTHDLQATWRAPWNGRITLGVRNAGDRAAPLDPFWPTGHAFDYDLYDGDGRVPYVRYTQDF